VSPSTLLPGCKSKETALFHCKIEKTMVAMLLLLLLLLLLLATMDGWCF
jgi:hypothetical protein